jgi:hypothetical protein
LTRHRYIRNPWADAKTWYYRGWLYYKFYQAKEDKFKSLDPDPLKQAYQSFVKAKELDVKDRWKDELIFRLTQTSADYFNKGGPSTSRRNFPSRCNLLKRLLTIGKLPYINQLDTGSFYNAALAAEAAAGIL